MANANRVGSRMANDLLRRQSVAALSTDSLCAAPVMAVSGLSEYPQVD
jgi:hypothetical protein